MKSYALFQQYIWLVNTIHKYRKLTLDEINRHWLDSDMSEGLPIARSTFNRHRDAILDLFGVIIECDKKDGFRYYIYNEEVLEEDIRGPDRCKNRMCKSCAYREIRYEEELKIKENTVRSAFLKEGLADIDVLPTVPSPKLNEYRNKAQYPISKSKDGEYVIGFFAPKTHTVCEAADCPISPLVFSDILELLRDFFKRYSFIQLLNALPFS